MVNKKTADKMVALMYEALQDWMEQRIPSLKMSIEQEQEALSDLQEEHNNISRAMKSPGFAGLRKVQQEAFRDRLEDLAYEMREVKAGIAKLQKMMDGYKQGKMINKAELARWEDEFLGSQIQEIMTAAMPALKRMLK